MSSYKGLETDEVELLPHQQKYVQKTTRRRFSPCQTSLVTVGVLVLFLFGYGAALLSVKNISSLSRWLIPSLQNSTTALPKLEKLPDIVLPTLFGTNTSAPFVQPNSTDGNSGGSGAGFSLVNSFELALSNGNSQPRTAFIPNCDYIYRRHLLPPSGSLPIADFIRASGKIERNDVFQGQIGDCGFGASLISLLANGQQELVKRSLELRALDDLRARFFTPIMQNLIPNTTGTNGEKVSIVRIDDTLPFSKDSGCANYMSYSPGDDNGRKVAFIPLLEKAWAKFSDANPQLRGDQLGYFGLTGTLARNVLASFQGGRPILYERKAPGFDATMASYLIECINLRRACVVGTPFPQSPWLGNFVNGKFSTVAGVITQDDGGKTFTILEADTGKEITVVGSHYYGFSSPQYIDGELITFDNAEIDIHNPWACNVNSKSNGACAPGVDRTVRLRLKTLPYLITGVEWAEPIAMIK